MTIQKIVFQTAIFLVAVFLFSGCVQYKLEDMKGHWWVKEDKAGYLEFLMYEDTMHVCSPKYGQLYYGKIEINGNQLIQYKEDNANEVRLTGQIVFFKDDSLVLRYDESLEYCHKISDSLPIIPDFGCYANSKNRALMQD